jgi:GH25 family lysozyme M1 (1,4-beta-N-acetylmuramidase)
MDLQAARADGMSFFTHKATEGTSIVHQHYGEAMRAARDAGMPILGPYAVPRTPGVGGHGSVAAQVSYFLSYIDAQTPWWWEAKNTFIQVDLEHWSNARGLYDAVSPATGKTFADLVAKRTGKRVIIYASHGQYGETLADIGYPLWNARYGTNPILPWRAGYTTAGGDANPGWSPYSGQTPAILQYGSRLRVGSQDGCDVNAFRGSLDELRALLTPEDLMAGWDEVLSNNKGATFPAANWLMGISEAVWLAPPSSAMGQMLAATKALTEATKATNTILEREFAKLSDLMAANAVQELPVIDAAMLRDALRSVLGGLDGAVPPAPPE